METASRQLQLKIEGAKSLLDKIAQTSVNPPAITAVTNELVALEMRVALSTSHLYILALSGGSEKQRALTEFMRILAAEDFAGELDRLVARGENELRFAGVPLRDDHVDTGSKASRRGRGGGRGGAGRGRGGAIKSTAIAKAAIKLAPTVVADIQRAIDMYPRGDADHGGNLANGSVQQVDYVKCPQCSIDMATDAGRSELKCGGCGATRELPGTVFDDSQFYSQEGQKAKSGTFNPNRHFQFWWVRILAKEPEEEIGDKDDPDNIYGEKLIEAMRVIVARDRKILRRVSVNDGRAMLRELERTDLNKNVPLILKKLTGIGPPSVSDAIAARVENIFAKAIEIGERVRRDGRINRNYYPFYIFKIIENIVPEEDYETRRVLYYIYVQSRDTVEADDDDWEQICLELSSDLTYIPTDRTLGMKYAPV
jgi:hypothetical protein